MPEYSFEAASSGEFEEYTGWGGMRYAEPCLKVTFDGGVRDLVLKYISHQTGEDTLTLRLKDIQRELFVGAVLMHRGLNLKLGGDFDSTMVILGLVE